MTLQQFHTKFFPDATAEVHGNVATFNIPAKDIVSVVEALTSTASLSLKLITATDERFEQGGFRVWYVFGVPEEKTFLVLSIRLTDTLEFPSVSAVCPAAIGHERRLRTFFGLTPVGHPDPRPSILHENWPAGVFPLCKDFDGKTRPGVAQGEYRFQEVGGEGIYEIPVGPIHAGIIEPGHFRFSMAGERIVLLEPRLGFVHKGSEKLFEMLSLSDQVRLSEKISGDSSFHHSLAFCQAVEQLAGLVVSRRAAYLRLMYAELERLANHFGDIGAIMLDTGFNFGGAAGARLREMVMQINERLTGSRFLRGVNVVGGVTKDIDAQTATTLIDDLVNIQQDFAEVIDVAENSLSLMSRLKGAGTVTSEQARSYGAVGVAARATGMATDARFDSPYAAYDELVPSELVTESDGDVLSRFLVRVREASVSLDLIQQALRQLPEGLICQGNQALSLRPNAVAISAVEGWRGEIVSFLTTDAAGKISRVAPRDPSFVNWNLLPDAGLDNVIPDFPLINKSFNLSYSGNDL